MSLSRSSEVFVSEPVLSDFAGKIRGSAIRPDHPDYDQARRVFNGMIDKRPGLIVTPADTSDVQRSVNFAREHGLLVSVKGGGHSVQGFGVCEGGLMIDLGLMHSVRVDPKARTASAEGGTTWGEFDAATQEHGLAIPGGRVPSTGIGGLTLGSGSGWLERKLGYTVDSMIGAGQPLWDGGLRLDGRFTSSACGPTRPRTTTKFVGSVRFPTHCNPGRRRAPISIT